MNVFYKTILDMTNQFFVAIILRMTKVEINDGKNSQTMLIVALDMDFRVGTGLFCSNALCSRKFQIVKLRLGFVEI